MSDQLPEGWRLAKLEELCPPDAPIIYGILQPGPELAEGVAYVRPTEIVDDTIDLSAVRRTSPAIAHKYRRATLKTGDVLLSIVGTIGKVAVVPPELDGANITQSSVRIRPGANVSSAFIKALLKSPAMRAQFDGLRLGTGVPRLNVGDVRQLSCPLPPPKEQRRIVAKLEALQARSRRAREALDAVPPLLEKLRQSILAAAFRGDLTREWRAQHPDVEPATELLKRIRVERRAKWAEAELAKMIAKGKAPKDDRWKAKYEEPKPVDASGLPELPVGWCWATWSEVGFSQNGRPFPSAQYAAEGIKLLRPGNLHVTGNVVWNDENTRRLPEVFARENQDLIVGANELVMNLTAQSLKDEFLGRLCVTGDAETCLLNQRIARLTPVLLSPAFVLWMFKSAMIRVQIDVLNTGSLIQHMFTSQVDRFHLPLPPAAEQQAILETVATSAGRIETLRAGAVAAAAQLGHLDRMTLSRAFRGGLVPQDRNDERVRLPSATTPTANNASAPSTPGGRGRRKAS